MKYKTMMSCVRDQIFVGDVGGGTRYTVYREMAGEYQNGHQAAGL